MAELDTPRLRLRHWRASDLDAWAAMCADPRVMTWLGGTFGRERAAEDAAMLGARLERNGFGWWVVEVKGGAPFAGLVALQDVPFVAPFTPALEVGWRLAAGAWGNGYATEGARAALAHAFGALDRSEVVALTAKTNEPSQRVMRRLGMTYDPADDFDNPRVAVDSPLRPHVLYRLRRP
ncbi:MAG: GNAT family N-acetyltransferase [Vulcanimicrobiaceae bacterium]